MAKTIGSFDLASLKVLRDDVTQYFWFESDSSSAWGSGAHVTLYPESQFTDSTSPNYMKGQNIIMNTDGISIRNGGLPMMVLDNDSLDFNAVDTTQGTYVTMATFGLTGATIGQTSGAHVQISSSGLDVNLNSSTNVANFGTTARIGKVDESHLEMDYHSMRLVDGNQNTYFYISGLLDADGKYTDTFIGDGSTVQFTTSYPMIQATIEVKIDGVVTTAYTSNIGVITFSVAPANDSIITITYEPYRPEELQAYTFGTRLNNPMYRVGGLSVSEGKDNVAQGLASHAEGEGVIALRDGSHAEGYNTKAYGYYSHAEGNDTIAGVANDVQVGKCSHAEGMSSVASGDCSHAEGGGVSYEYRTEASGDYSHAEGYSTRALGDYSHTEGGGTVALGTHSHAQNLATRTESNYQTALGKYNIADNADTYAVIIGNGNGISGDAKERSNALTVDWNGHVVATSAKKSIMYTGEFISVYGNQTASETAGQITLSGSYKNMLPANKYSTGLSPLGSDLFSVSAGTVTLNKDGRYRVYGQIYIYNSFTVNDQVTGCVTYNGTSSNLRSARTRVSNAAPYETLSIDTYVNAAAGAELQLVALNDTAARGKIGISSYTKMFIECLGVYE